jgi:hypothetical protein
MPTKTTRRDLLMTTLFGAGCVGLRALASGIPASVLLAPRLARADAPPAPPVPPQYVVFSTSGTGDPINASVPGTYGDPNIVHSPDPAMAPAPLTLRGAPYTAAAPWATLPQAVLDRTCFFHLMTNTPVHPKEPDVLSLMGTTADYEMLPSILAAQLAPSLGTIQKQPVCIGAASPSEAIASSGQTLPIVPPVALKATLASPAGPLAQLQSLRDETVDSLYALYKSHANDAGQRFVDALARSQTQARSIQQSLLDRLASIQDNGPASQVLAAITLIQMNVAPVITIHVPFGGDNHRDLGLATETSQTIAGVRTIASLMQQLASAGLADRVTFATLNVFGRTLGPGNANGRQHNPDHQASLMIGRGVAGGVVGGVAPVGDDYGALPLDSTSGRGDPGGDVTAPETLPSFGKTLLKACGVDDASVRSTIVSGKVVAAALA